MKKSTFIQRQKERQEDETRIFIGQLTAESLIRENIDLMYLFDFCL